MKIAHLNTQTSGVGDYRHVVPARALRKRGHTVWSAPPEATVLDCLQPTPDEFIVDIFTKYDIVHAGFGLDESFYLPLATGRNYASKALNRNVPVVLDCDDNVSEVPTYNQAYKAYAATKSHARATILGMRMSDAVTVTTPYLTELYSNANAHVSILPNCLEPTDWADLPLDPKRRESKDIRIVFAGNIGRLGDLDTIQQALESVMRQRPQARLFFMGMMPPWVQEQWCADPTNPMANRAFFIGATNVVTYRRVKCWIGADICLAPVAKNGFNRGKSSIKVMESAMYGAASVCTDWDTYAEVPADCTLKCDTTYEWTESLLALIDDPTLRQKKVAACRDWVLSCKTIDGNIHLWEECYNEALSRPVIDSDGNGIKSMEVRLATPQEVAAISQPPGG